MCKVRMIFLLILSCSLSGCAYIESVSRQVKLVQDQKVQPSQYKAKHIIENDNYFVYGKLKDGNKEIGTRSLAVAATSDDFERDETVDVNHIGKVGSYYALHLPEGEYELLVLEDENEDGMYSGIEVIGSTVLNLTPDAYSSKVIGNVDIQLFSQATPFAHKLEIPVHTVEVLEQSFFYPKGSIRPLDDPVFSRRISKLGLYDPPAFLEIAPMMFYALEEDTAHKVPVIFVHGISGSPTEFRAIISSLDRDRYKPWFFYYPSGSDLGKLAELFYDIYLSGKVVGRGSTDVVIVAHSMGGLVVREALNLYEGDEKEIPVKLFISMASPFGGISSAQSGVDNAPLVIPVWRNLTPKGGFIKNLFRNPLPSSVEHHLIYAYRNSGDEDDSDGIVPVRSQLPMAVEEGLSGRYGFKAGHAEILKEQDAIDVLISLISQVRSPFPDEHLFYIDMGGFDVELDNSYSGIEKRLIRNNGFYMRAVANGDVAPVPLNRHFLHVMQGKAEPLSPVDTAWLKFRSDYPELASGVQGQ